VGRATFFAKAIVSFAVGRPGVLKKVRPTRSILRVPFAQIALPCVRNSAFVSRGSLLPPHPAAATQTATSTTIFKLECVIIWRPLSVPWAKRSVGPVPASQGHPSRLVGRFRGAARVRREVRDATRRGRVRGP
jgi:hypothetical protein